MPEAEIVLALERPRNIGNTSYDQVDNDDGLELDIADDPMTLNLGCYEKTLQVTRFKVLVDYRDVLGALKHQSLRASHRL